MPSHVCHQFVNRGATVIPRDFRMQQPPLALDRIEVRRVRRQEVQLHLRRFHKCQPRLTTAVDAVVVHDQVDLFSAGMPPHYVPHQIDEQPAAFVPIGHAGHRSPAGRDRSSGDSASRRCSAPASTPASPVSTSPAASQTRAGSARRSPGVRAGSSRRPPGRRCLHDDRPCRASSPSRYRRATR